MYGLGEERIKYILEISNLGNYVEVVKMSQIVAVDFSIKRFSGFM